MRRINNRFLVLLGALVCLFGISVSVAVADKHDDPRCLGLKGAALGMCSAAVAVGCDSPDAKKGGCEKLEEKYIEITGEKKPPWELTVCSDNLECAIDEYCQAGKTTDRCTGEGLCQEKPTHCLEPNPDGKGDETVCGCDGINYVSGCEATRFGVRVLHLGYCK